jgi:hypothetical protein
VKLKRARVPRELAQRISKIGSTLYPHAARIAGYLAATLSGEPAQPSLVAKLMVDAAEAAAVYGRTRRRRPPRPPPQKHER